MAETQEAASLQDNGIIWTIPLDEIQISKILLAHVGADFAIKHMILPISSSLAEDGNTVEIKCATSRYSNLKIQGILSRACKGKITFVFTEPENILNGLVAHYNLSAGQINFERMRQSGKTDEQADEGGNALESGGAANDPYARQSNYGLIYRSILDAAVVQKASDVHLLPKPAGIQIRFRVNGSLVDYSGEFKVGGNVSQERLFNLIKQSCSPPMEESKTTSADGRIAYKYKALDETVKTVDCRVSAVPVEYGQKMVIRLLPDETSRPQLEELGYFRGEILAIKKAAYQPKGITFLTGPTGSGKSTTLEAIDGLFPEGEYNKIHLADPIEFKNPNITQIQVNERAEDEKNQITYHGIMRNIVRQDPDIVTIGEIRDHESAKAAIELSVTGHRIFATIHAGDVLEAFSRFDTLGIDKAAMLRQTNAIVAQRLLQEICPHCRQTYSPEADILALFPEELTGGIKTFYKGAGCPRCNGTGVSRRFAVGEILLIDNDIRDIIKKDVGLVELTEYLHSKKGFVSLADKAIDYVRQGQVAFDTLVDIIPR
jgi:type II secretory ATPase GspE/PulE/Tfp pilus assembly ATPase PilB-like protein